MWSLCTYAGSREQVFRGYLMTQPSFCWSGQGDISLAHQRVHQSHVGLGVDPGESQGRGGRSWEESSHAQDLPNCSGKLDNVKKLEFSFVNLGVNQMSPYWFRPPMIPVMATARSQLIFQEWPCPESCRYVCGLYSTDDFIILGFFQCVLLPFHAVYGRTAGWELPQHLGQKEEVGAPVQRCYSSCLDTWIILILLWPQSHVCGRWRHPPPAGAVWHLDG